ncbi:hypothetical protein [Streptomyces zaomyceticus]
MAAAEAGIEVALREEYDAPAPAGKARPRAALPPSLPPAAPPAPRP